MRRTALLSLLTLAAFVAAPAAAADGPMFAAQGGLGALNAKGTLRYIPVGVAGSTALEAVRTADGAIFNWRELTGSWGLPAIGSSSQAALSHDGRTIVLERTAFGTSSTFLLLDPRTLQLDDRLTLRGSFTFDAFSPDASRMYLIQYLDGTIDHYIVRAYDLSARKLLPGRIADRTQRGWVMQGSPVTRTASTDGRWVYTLYTNPGGYPFVHALDTVRGVAHCVGLPLTDQSGIYDLRLRLDGDKLLLRWRSGKPYYAIDTTTWRLSQPATATRSSSLWSGGSALAALLLCAASAAVLLGRRRVSLRAV